MRTLFKIEKVGQVQDEIKLDLQGDPVEVIQMLCLSMEEWEQVKITILTAARHYMKEHNISSL